MNGVEQKWQEIFKRELHEALNHFTPTRYPATLLTQQHYQDQLAKLATNISERLDKMDSDERQKYDAKFRRRALRELDRQENAQSARARNDKDLMNNRAIQQSQREALREPGPDNLQPPYRQSQTYKDGMQQLIEQQAARFDQANQAIRLVSDKLDERFGFTRRRDQDRDR